MREKNSQTFQSVDGPVKCVVQQLGGKRAFKLSLRLAKSIFPALAAVGASKDRAAQFAAISQAVEKLSVDELDSLLSDLLKDHLVIFDEAKGVVHSEGFERIDALFTGKAIEIYKLFYFALEVNFADFFGMLRASKKGSSAPQVPEPPALT